MSFGYQICEGVLDLTWQFSHPLLGVMFVQILGPAFQICGVDFGTKMRRSFRSKKWRNDITYILSSPKGESRIPTFFGTKIYAAKLERGPQNLDNHDTQQRVRKLPRQIKNALATLIPETHQMWYTLGCRWRVAL